MMSNDKKSHMPNPPTSIGLSRRLFITAISFVLSVLLLFFIFLKSYSTEASVHHRVKVTASINQEDSSAQIAKIAREGHHPVLINSDPHTKSTSTEHGNSPANPSEAGLRDTSEFQAGGNAGISVYHSSVSGMESRHAQGNYSNNAAIGGLNALGEVKALSVDAYAAQNRQSEKIAFLKQSHQKSNHYINSQLENPISPYQINVGTIIPATLMTGLHSDLPGTMIAKVRRDVFDTVSGNYLLIPQGTTLMGQYDSKIAYGQSRVLIVWSRLIFPNGTSFDLQRMPGADLRGMAGLYDKVDHHYTRLFGSALLMSVFGAVGQLGQSHHAGHSNESSPQEVFSAAVAQQISQTAMQFVQKNMNVQPTIKIRPGSGFNVLLTRDMVLPRPYHFSK